MFGHFLNKFIEYYNSVKRVSPHTITAYTTDLTQFQTYCKLIYDCTDAFAVNHMIIRSYIMQLSEDGLSSTAINRKISSLRSFFQFLKKNHKLKVNPTSKIQALKTPKRLPKFIKEDEASKMLEREVVTDDPYERHRDLLIMELLYTCGLRRSELINLKLTDLDFAAKQMTIIGKGNKQRVIPLTTHLITEIKKLLDLRSGLDALSDDSYLFLLSSGKKLYPNKVYRIVKSYLSRYSRSNKKSPHVLRHSFATHLSNQGAEIQAIKELLGHASLAATQIYTHNTIDKLKEVYSRSHPKS